MGNPNFGYLAGLLDGEGTINIYREHNGKHVPKKVLRTRMVISSTSLDLMNYLKKTYGLVYIQKKNYPSHYGKKIIYHAVFNQHQILSFGKKMLPHLIIKHDRMVEVLEYLQKNLRNYGKWKK